MAKFAIGQRVRILWSNNWPELAGEEATVVGLVTDGQVGSDGIPLEYRVAPDCWGSDTSPRPGIRRPDMVSRFAPNGRQLEPLQKNDGNTIVSWAECVWQPPHLRNIPVHIA